MATQWLFLRTGDDPGSRPHASLLLVQALVFSFFLLVQIIYASY